MTVLLKANDLTVRFALGKKGLFGARQHLEAVRSVSFTLAKGRALGIVGESGSGKTTTAMLLYGSPRPQAGRCSLKERIC